MMNSAKDMQNKGPLSGIKVLDLSRILAGPSATQLLGDLGADVVKVEQPPWGDDTRKWGPPYVEDRDGNPTTESGYYLSANRNKRSIALDLSTAEGAETVRKLAMKSDILIENFKVGGLKKYNLAYEDLSKINPRLIYCSITGFGQTGPHAHRAGYDIMAQGYGGIMSLTGPTGSPHKVGVAIADVMTGMYAVVGALSALWQRGISGKGQYIDLSLVDTQVSWLINPAVNYLLNGVEPQSMGNGHPNIVPYQAFAVADGHVIIAVGNDRQFKAFVDILGHGEWADDERFAQNSARVVNRDALLALLTPALAAYKRDDLLKYCEAAGVPSGPVNQLEDVFTSDQVIARDMIVQMAYPEAKDGKVSLLGNPLKFSATPVEYRLAPPHCDEHHDEILADWLGDD